MRDLYITLIYASFLVLGVTAPFVAMLGYVWVDVFTPQYLTSNLIHDLPISSIMGAAAFILYLALDRRDPPRVNAIMVLTGLMAVWVTLTTTWADVPVAAWDKWNWAVKTVLFSAFIPFVIRSRVQIEAFALVWLCASAAHLMPVGVKTMVSGAGYGRALGLLATNETWMSESSAVSALAIALIPVALWMRKHSLILPAGRLRQWGLAGLSVIFVFTAVGTFARTAIVGFAVVGFNLMLQSRRKILFIVVAAGIGGAALLSTSSDYSERMSTIEDYNSETSAYVRILVWRWTLGYVVDHPFGGGFNNYMLNRIEIPNADGEATDVVQFGRAFHSAYFEMLGEQGFVGFGLFAAIILLTIRIFHQVRRATRDRPDMLWCHELSRALLVALYVIIGCAAFIGVAFQMLFWYMFALATCLQQYVRRVQSEPEPMFRHTGDTRSGGPLPHTPVPVREPALPGVARHPIG